jgi:hypothetical protein
MKTDVELSVHRSDPAAIFASALSLWQACQECATGENCLNLSECYNGMDQLMREVMRVGNQFEAWACLHIDFEQLSDVWSYLLEDKFGSACLAAVPPGVIASFDESDCLRVALRLRLPIICDGTLPVPMTITATNPAPESAFHEFRIQTVRNGRNGEDPAAYTLDDDPFDEEFGLPYFGLYGVGQDGLFEHIADRATYLEVVTLVRKLVPGIVFPDIPTSSPSASAPK